MIRFLFRFLGLICLAAAFSLVIVDGMTSIADSHLIFISVQGLWERMNPGSLARLRPLIEPYLDGLLWDPAMVSILAAPAWGLLGLLGILLILFGRKKKPLIGYAR